MVLVSIHYTSDMIPQSILLTFRVTMDAVQFSYFLLVMVVVLGTIAVLMDLLIIHELLVLVQ